MTLPFDLRRVQRRTHFSREAGVVFDPRAWLITAHRIASTRPATTESDVP